MNPRSRSDRTLSSRARAISARPLLNSSASGGDQSWCQYVMADPQCAMAQDGSAAATSRKAFSEASYAKECSSATARSKLRVTPGAQEVANATVPSLSGGGCECISWADATAIQAAAPLASRETTRFTLHLLRRSLKCRPRTAADPNRSVECNSLGICGFAPTRLATR